MVSPRTPFGKRYWPSGQNGEGEVGEYVDPFVQHDLREGELSRGWVNWVWNGVRQGYDGVSFVVSKSRDLGSRQQIPLEVTQPGSSNDFHDAHDGKEEQRQVRNALAASRDTEIKEQISSEPTEADIVTSRQWKPPDAGTRLRREERSGLELGGRDQNEQKVSHLGGPGFLIPGQGFVPL